MVKKKKKKLPDRSGNILHYWTNSIKNENTTRMIQKKKRKKLYTSKRRKKVHETNKKTFYHSDIL